VPAPAVVGFTITGNVATWTLASALGDNKYVISIASTGASFGTAVTDTNGAGLDGEFVTSRSTFTHDGDGKAGGTFNFYFNVLPGDGNQNGIVNAQDLVLTRQLTNKRSTAPGYNIFIDYIGQGVINATDTTIDNRYVNSRQTAISSPAAPTATELSPSLTEVALGLQEGASSSTTSTPAVTNFVATTSNGSSSSFSSSSSNAGSAGASNGSTNLAHRHGRHFNVHDQVVSAFDLTDLWV
jgi:hypothetical protein